MRQQLPPGPSSGFFGRRLLRRSREQPLQFMADLARDYGDIVHFRTGWQPVFFLNHPDYIRDVLLTHYENFRKGRGIDRRKTLLGAGLLTTEGEFHRRQRQRTQPAFHRHRIASYGAVMVDCATAHSERWEEGQTLDVLQEMRRLTLSIIGRTMFSFQSDSEIGALDKAVETAMRQFQPFRLRLARLANRLPLPSTLRSRRAERYLETEMCRMIDERRKSGEDNGDLLTMLLLAQGADTSGSVSDNEQVQDEALTIFLGGYETNATALMWTWYLLSLHPECEARLHEELDRVLGDRAATADDLPNLRYTEMALAESIRLFPPVWRLMRYAIRDYEVGGYVVPAGSLVVLSQYVMHRDPRYYDDPLRFDPERWTPEAKASRPQYSYFPFGGGSRRCIGESFAWMEGVLVLATLAQRWRLRCVPDYALELARAHLLRPKDGMPMVLERRSARGETGDRARHRPEDRDAEDAIAQAEGDRVLQGRRDRV